MRSFTLLYMLALLIPLCSCGDTKEDEFSEVRGDRLTSLSNISAPLAWSMDGSEIYIVTGAYLTADTNHLKAVNAVSGMMRDLAGPCVRPGMAVVNDGVAYVIGCHHGAGELHLIRGDKDTLIDANVDRVSSIRHGNGLVFFRRTSEDQGIYLVDVATLESRYYPHPPFQDFPWPLGTPETSPDDTELLFCDNAEPSRVVRLSLAMGTWSEVTLYPSMNLRELIGWSGSGALALAGSDGSNVIDVLTGEIKWHLPRLSGISSQWQHGFLSPDGSQVGLWREVCILSGGGGTTDPYSTCDQYADELLAYDPGDDSFQVLGRTKLRFGAGQHERVAPYSNGAFSPDGKLVAYTLKGDVYVSTIE